MQRHLQIKPSLDEFRELARKGNVVPVYAEFIADCETPISAFAKLGQSDYSFLFESTEKNEISGRFSFLGADPRAIVTANGAADPFDQLRQLMSRYQFVAQPDLPRFCGGAVGFLGYEMINYFEPKVLRASRDDLQLPEMLFMITSSILVFDHQLRTLKVVANAFLDDGAPEKVYAHAVDKIGAIVDRLTHSADLSLIAETSRKPSPPRSNLTRENFQTAIEQGKRYIRAGDIFQVVLSQRFEADFAGDALEFYRCLRFVNPSPYMFCLKLGRGFALVGSSPEMHVRLVGRHVEIRPIAGTRRRGATPEEDETNAADLLANEKERAEHIMLVDLARNDVGRVAEIGSVRVTEFMNVERYSHVMHIVSNVAGELRQGCDVYDLIRATFPAGTVSGAPKIRAMQIIAELEQTRRGCYAGAIGYIGFDGNLDSCIALRSAILKNGRVYFQAGAGIVADSDPAAEFEETISKADAVARALALTS